MTESKNDRQINNSILGALGNNNQVTQNIHLQPGQPAPYMLPKEIGNFTGRADYISQVEEILERSNIVAIGGMAGVGKSALAIQVAHQLKDRFADAQLCVNLYGQMPELSLEPKTVLIRFLTALTGRDESQLATDLDGLVAQYRSTLATTRALIILDNARDEAQIRDLLPSSSNCKVVVTSRSRLTGLPEAELVDLLPMAVGTDGELGESELLFQAILHDRQRVAADIPTARQIVKLCGGLPIAIRIAAATLNQQIWAKKLLQAYVGELAAESTRLQKLVNPQVEAAIPGQGSVQASFNLSYWALADAEQQLFRWAGGLPGVEFGMAVLAAVMEREESQIETGLGLLLEAQVLELRGEDRFGWHDLMRLFSREQLTESERKTVVDRGLTWYCQQADFWENGLNPLRCRQLAQQWAAETEHPAEAWEEALPTMALAWFTAEQKNWVDIVKDLTQIPRTDDAVALAANLAAFFNLRSIWGDWVTTNEMVKNCAQQAGNLAGVSTTLHNLGTVYLNQGRWEKAIDCYQESLKIYRQQKDCQGEAQSLNNLGGVYKNQGRWEDAISCYQESLKICRQFGDRHGTAPSLMNLGIVYKNQGKWEEAIDCYQKSLEICCQFGDRHGAAQILMALGTVYNDQSKFEQSIACYQASLETKDQLGDRHGAAQIRNNLGLIYRNQSKWEEAISLHQESLETFRELGDRHGEAQALGNLGNVYLNQGKWEEAIAFYEKDLQISRELGDPHGEAQTLGNLGLAYENQDKLNEAIALYTQSLKIKHQLGDCYGEAQTLGNLGNVYYKQDNPDDAIALYKQSLKIKRELGDYHGEAQTLTNLGVVIHKQGKSDKAISCFQKSLEIFRQLGDPRWEGINLMNLGVVHHQRNHIEQAQTLWRKALTYLHPSSPEFQTVQQWLETSTQPR
jgi:tetratricopeptide (TPR) repeat protein